MTISPPPLPPVAQQRYLDDKIIKPTNYI